MHKFNMSSDIFRCSTQPKVVTSAVTIASKPSSMQIKDECFIFASKPLDCEDTVFPGTAVLTEGGDFGKLTVAGDLVICGMVTTYGLTVYGSLYSYGEIDCYANINVVGDIISTGNIVCDDISCGGNVVSEMSIACRKLNAYGDVNVGNTFTADSVELGGILSVEKHFATNHVCTGKKFQ